MKKALLLCALGTAFLGSQVAKADTFNFSFTGSDFSGSGVFTTSAGVTTSGHTTFTVTDVTGSVDFNGFGTFSIGGVDNFEFADNEIHETGGVYSYDHFGVSFWIDDAPPLPLDSSVNLSDISTRRGTTETAQSGIAFLVLDTETVTDTITPTSATPEPGSLALLGTSVLGGAGILRRRFRA